MRSRQRPDRVVVKPRRHPGHIRVAKFAVRREAGGRMVWVGRLVEIRRVTGRTIRWRPRKTVRVAVDALGRLVRPVEREIRCVVVKRCVRIPRWVAGQTGRAIINIPVHARMLVIRFRVRMAGRAGELPKIRRVLMAFNTLRPLVFMFPRINWEKLAVVPRKIRGHPI